MCMTDGDTAGKRSAIVLDLFDRYYERVHAFARRSVDANVAEDVTQEAFTRLLQHPRLEEMEISISYSSGWCRTSCDDATRGRRSFGRSERELPRGNDDEGNAWR